MAKSIEEAELRALEKLRAKRAEAKARLEALEVQVQATELSLVLRIQGGAGFRGRLVGFLERGTGPSRPHYKEELVAHFEQAHGIAGALVVAECHRRWPGEPTVRLVVAPKPKGGR